MSYPGEAIPEVARYYNPPGWPMPTRRWMLEHQGAGFAPGWVPTSGLPAAPTGWIFWTPDGPDAAAVLGSALRPLKLWTAAGFGVAAIAWGLSAASYSAAAAGGSYVVLWGGVLFGLVTGVTNAVKLIGAKRRVFAIFASALAETRAATLAAEYRGSQQRDGSKR